jgi:hypothetical protein
VRQVEIKLSLRSEQHAGTHLALGLAAIAANFDPAARGRGVRAHPPIEGAPLDFAHDRFPDPLRLATTTIVRQSASAKISSGEGVPGPQPTDSGRATPITGSPPASRPPAPGSSPAGGEKAALRKSLEAADAPIAVPAARRAQLPPEISAG